jgi:hypothetical protein
MSLRNWFKEITTQTNTAGENRSGLLSLPEAADNIDRPNLFCYVSRRNAQPI